MACGIFVSRPGIEPRDPAARSTVLKHWTSGKVVFSKFLSFASQCKVHQGNRTHHRLAALSHTEHTRVALRWGRGAGGQSPEQSPCLPSDRNHSKGTEGWLSELLTAPGVGTGERGSCCSICPTQGCLFRFIGGAVAKGCCSVTAGTFCSPFLLLVAFGSFLVCARAH